MTRYTIQCRVEARATLLGLLTPGDTVYTVLRHVSASGMSRAIDLYVIQDNEPRRITWSAAAVLRLPYNDHHEALTVSGCGMDMGFHAAYSLGAALWPDGFTCAGDRCPSNEHTNGAPRPHPYPATYWSHAHQEYMPTDPADPCPEYRCGLPASEHPTQPAHHRGGGYALRHEWI